MIAKAFREVGEDDELLIFASGVSDSNEVSGAEYKREKDLLLGVIQQNPEKTIIYFSSCDIVNNNEHARYYAHKINMEEMIKECANNFCVFRLPQVVGINDNKTTLLNYLFFKIKNNECFDIWTNAGRRLIGIDDVVLIVSHILKNEPYRNSIINVASSIQYSVLDIVRAIEKHLNIKSLYCFKNKGCSTDIDLSLVSDVAPKLGIDFKDKYLERLITRYYSSR